MKPDPARLSTLPLFASLSPDELEHVAGWMELSEVSAGAQLVTEGAPGYVFFVIEEGTADVLQNGERLTELGPGDFFGEVAILDGGRRTATVTATSPARVVAMFGTEFRQLEAELPTVADRIRATMAERTK
jgi:CRP-like cAMP-binding protein